MTIDNMEIIIWRNDTLGLIVTPAIYMYLRVYITLL